MKAIVIKYLGATDHRGARLKATSGAGNLIEGRDYGLDTDVQAREMALDYLDKFDWQEVVISGFGTLPNGDYVATLKRR